MAKDAAGGPFPGFLTGTLPMAEPEIYERWNFLEALQIERPGFWRDLRQVETQGSKESVVSWMIRSGVTDPWFIDVIWDTVGHWSTFPESPLSRLESDRNWFWYDVVQGAVTDPGRFQIPPLQPWFVDRDFPEIHPNPYTPAGKPEPLDEFQRRVKRVFDAQLSTYIKYVKSLSAQDRQYLREHAIWTARAFIYESWECGVIRRPAIV
jgi:hypothetical protein